jgi:hypothetical protein
MSRTPVFKFSRLVSNYTAQAAVTKPKSVQYAQLDPFFFVLMQFILRFGSGMVPDLVFFFLDKLDTCNDLPSVYRMHGSIQNLLSGSP